MSFEQEKKQNQKDHALRGQASECDSVNVFFIAVLFYMQLFE